MRRPKNTVTVIIPDGLAQASARLVRDFAQALATKLRAAEEKYGYRDGWLDDGWETECRQHLREHMAKGDPRDVAIYAAFMWQHRWSTAEPRIPEQGLPEEERHGRSITAPQSIRFQPCGLPKDRKL